MTITSLLPNGWRTVTIGKISRLITSGSRGWARYYAASGDAFIRMGNLRRETISIDLQDVQFICLPDDNMEGTRTKIEPGDILLSITADVGRIAFIESRLPSVSYISQHLCLIRIDDKKMCPKFVAYQMKGHSIQKSIRELTDNGAKAGLSLPTVSKIVIPLAPIVEQRRIADILNTWDTALSAAKANTVNSQRLYYGLANERICVRGAAMRPLADLLRPDRMKCVEPNGPFRALGVRSYGKGTFHRIDDLAALGSDKTLYRVEPGRFIVNIVFAWEGAAAITSEKDAGCLVSHRFPTFTINERLILPDYLRHMVRMKHFRHLMALASPGGAGRNKTLNRHDLLDMEVHIPPLAEQRKVADALTTLERRSEAYALYVDRLTAQRDALATKLLTGQIRVPEGRTAALAVGE